MSHCCVLLDAVRATVQLVSSAFRLVFSQSLLSLDIIELFLGYKDEDAQAHKPKKVRLRHLLVCKIICLYPVSSNFWLTVVICMFV